MVVLDLVMKVNKPRQNIIEYVAVLDIRVHLQLSRLSNTKVEHQQPQLSGLVKKKCFQCNKILPWSEMRCHVGKQVLNNERLGPKTLVEMLWTISYLVRSGLYCKNSIPF